MGPKLPLESKAMNWPLGLIDGFWLGDGAFDSLIRLVSFVWRSRRKTSLTPLLSAPPGKRLLAADSKTTKRPSALIPGRKLPLLPCVPSVATLTRSVWPVARSRTKMSVTPLVSLGTRFDESDSNATTLPSADTAGGAVGAGANPDASPPVLGTLTRTVAPGAAGWARKMSPEPLKSSPTRLSAAD